jgi:hypothetical protein
VLKADTFGETVSLAESGGVADLAERRAASGLERPSEWRLVRRSRWERPDPFSNLTPTSQILQQTWILNGLTLVVIRPYLSSPGGSGLPRWPQEIQPK